MSHKTNVRYYTSLFPLFANIQGQTDVISRLIDIKSFSGLSHKNSQTIWSILH